MNTTELLDAINNSLITIPEEGHGGQICNCEWVYSHALTYEDEYVYASFKLNNSFESPE